MSSTGFFVIFLKGLQVVDRRLGLLGIQAWA